MKRFPKDPPARMIKWVETFVIVPRGFGARSPMKLAPFQRELIRDIFGNDEIRSALVSLPRGNGKTSLAAALALYALLDDTVPDPEVIAVASDYSTAEILLRTARRMVELNPELAGRCVIYKDRIECPQTSGVLRALPSIESALHGRSPSLLILDELHMVTPEVWEACNTASGKRDRSKIVAISTPATRREGVMWDLVQHGRNGTDPTFTFIEYAAPTDCRIDDEHAWTIANPGIKSGILSIDGLRSTLNTTRPARFRQLRLGQWADSDESWIQYEPWMKLADTERVITGDERVVLGFDGSVSNDATVLAMCTVPESPEDKPHISIVAIWKRDRQDPNWQVPRDEVDSVIRQTMAEFNVEALCADPFFWQSELQRWDNEFGRVVSWATSSPQRMAKASDRFFANYQSGNLTHDGDEMLALHATNATLRDTPYGVVPVKKSKNSQQKIDALIASIIAHDYAMHLANQPTKKQSMTGVIFV
jgi:phage terminase large subunit-like protein